MSEKLRSDAPPPAPGEDGPVATPSGKIPTDDSERQRIDKLATNPQFQRLRTRLDAMADDAAETGGEDKYSEVQRSNQEATESLAAAKAKAAAAEAQQKSKTRRLAGSGGASRSGGEGSRKPRAACTLFKPARRASLPRLIKLGKDEADLPGFPNPDAPEPDSQMLLPLHGIADTVGCSSWLLWLFDRAGGDSWKGGRGAPWPLRLFVYALLHLDVAFRDGKWHAIPFETETVIGWLHPNGWQNMSRDWDLLPAALDFMRRLAYVPVPGFGRVAILFPSMIPSAPTDPLVEFTIRIPSVAARGDRLDWLLLTRYGAESASLFRAYLAAMAWLGRSSRNGHPVTRRIAEPMYHLDGTMRRRKGKGKGGAIVRSKTRFIPNHAAKYAGPGLTERDLANMMGFDGNDRRRRHDARSVFERMDSDGVIDLQRSGYRFGILGPSRYQEWRRKGPAGAAELLQTASRQADPLTRARLVDSATGMVRRAVVHALRDVPRDELVSAATLKKAARNLEIIAI